MKRHLIKLLLSLVILVTVSFSVSAQVYVKIRPVVPVVTVRPPQPSPRHVWIEEEWEPRGRDYRYSGGHWATPPRRGYHRRPGHWRHSNRGDVWIQGSWSRH